MIRISRTGTRTSVLLRGGNLGFKILSVLSPHSGGSTMAPELKRDAPSEDENTLDELYTLNLYWNAGCKVECFGPGGTLR